MALCYQTDQGKPEVVECAIPIIQGILGKIPFFGICLGHQLFALSQGASRFKNEVWSSWCEPSS